MDAPTVRTYGAPGGAPCVYFHGAPGGPEEGAWFDAEAAARGVRLLAIDRAQVAPGVDDDRYFDTLARETAELCGDDPVRLVGFSLGGFAALQVAARLERPPQALHLVSAAAPLQPGDLDAMAGGPVFRLAAASRALFAAATALQGGLSRAAPDALLNAVFASARGAEARLAADPAFRTAVIALMRESYGPRRGGYMRDVRLYARSSGRAIEAPGCRVSVWHGSDDTWSPPAMAARFGDAEVTIFPGLAHYACLFEAMPRILAGDGAGGGARAGRDRA